MNSLKNLKLGTRLGAGFGLVLLLMAIMAAMAVAQFAQVGKAADKIVNSDLSKVNASNTINLYSRDNSRQMVEAFLTDDKTQIARIRQTFEDNKKRIDAAVETLDKGLYSPAGKALLTRIRDARGGFLAAESKVRQQLDAGNRDEAGKLLFAEALPALDKLQITLGELDVLANKVIAGGSSEILEDIASARMMMLALGLAGLFIGIGFAWWVTRSITNPVNQAVNMARAVAAGDLTTRLEITSTDEIGQLLTALDEMNQSLADIVGKVRESSDSIATGSTQIATGNADLSQRTEEQASSLQQTAASMEELTSTVNQNADTARQANQLATSASEAATQGSVVVSEVVSTMEGITASSKKIADIISVIDGIAFQTNILALNAAVEAARAGEQGRGFAVVASEVRNLAQRSAEAAKEIKNLIGESVEKVEAGSKLVDDAGKSMVDIVAQVKRVNDLIAEISAAGVEQSSGISQIGDAVAQLDQVTQQNAALVEESAAAAESLKQQAAGLAEVVSVFKVGANRQWTAASAGAAVTAAASSGPNSVERRGPNRATNVTRPGFAARSAARLASPAVTAGKPVQGLPTKTGTDGWESL